MHITSNLLHFLLSFSCSKVYCCFLQTIAPHQVLLCCQRRRKKPELITFSFLQCHFMCVCVCHIFVVRIFTTFYQINPLRCCHALSLFHSLLPFHPFVYSSVCHIIIINIVFALSRLTFHHSPPLPIAEHFFLLILRNLSDHKRDSHRAKLVVTYEIGPSKMPKMEFSHFIEIKTNRKRIFLVIIPQQFVELQTEKKKIL